MLWTLFVLLLVLWLFGYIGLPAIGGLVHVLLVLAVIVLVAQLLSGRRVA